MYWSRKMEVELRGNVGLWPRDLGDEKALVKVEICSADRIEAQAKGGVLIWVELWSRS